MDGAGAERGEHAGRERPEPGPERFDRQQRGGRGGAAQGVDDGADGAAAALADADRVVLPWLPEGLAVALLEALAYRKAVLATRAGDSRILTDGIDGVLVSPGDADALAGAIAELAADPLRRTRLGRAARKRAERLSRGGVYDRWTGSTVRSPAGPGLVTLEGGRP